LKNTILSLHRWTGLAAGLFLSLIGLSGSLLVYHNAIDRALYPSLTNLPARVPALSIDSLFGMVVNRRGQGYASCSFDVPTSPGDALEFALTGPQENHYSRKRMFVDVDPSSGAILREGSSADISASFVHWLMYFHDSFHAGRIGMLIAALSAVAMAISVITGLIVHGKSIARVLTFRLPLAGRTGKRYFRPLHLYLSVWGLVLNLILMSTGFWMMRSTLSPSAWKLEPASSTVRAPVSIDRCLAASRAALPGFEPDFVEVPLNRGGEIEIDGNMENGPEILSGDASSVVFDGNTGELLSTKNALNGGLSEKFSAAVWPLHTGKYAPPAVRFLYFLAGFMPGLLFISGFVIFSV
jgi:uncharacterized iron-regulated membrane protein